MASSSSVVDIGLDVSVSCSRADDADGWVLPSRGDSCLRRAFAGTSVAGCESAQLASGVLLLSRQRWRAMVICVLVLVSVRVLGFVTPRSADARRLDVL